MENAYTANNIAMKERLRELSIDRKRTIALSPFEYKTKAQQAIFDWVNGWDCELDLACCWQASDFMRNQQRRWDEHWLQDQLSQYFRHVSIAVFGHLPVKQRPSIPRIITLEHTDEVGWHAHGMISTPQTLTREQFTPILKELWVRSMGGCHIGPIGEHIFWCDERPLTHCYYMLKWATEKNENRNEHLRGLLDVRNTRHP